MYFAIKPCLLCLSAAFNCVLCQDMATDSDSDSPMVYPCPEFSVRVPRASIVRIGDSDVLIVEPSQRLHTFDKGGSKEYFVHIETLEGKKKKQDKIITIYRKMPLCPISRLPMIEPKIAASADRKSFDDAVQFKVGFAFNCYQVDFEPHRKFDLKPVLYLRITNYIHLVVPIVDERHLHPSTVDALYTKLGNMDIVKKITDYYNRHAEITDKNFNFHMADTPIKAKTLYHRSGILKLFLDNALKIGIWYPSWIGFAENYTGNILILEPEAYNYVSPYGKVSPLKGIYSSCEDMMNYRRKILAKIKSVLSE